MKLKEVKKSIRHQFTPEEVAGLNVEFRQSFATLKSVVAEFDNVKAVWKAKTTEAESRMETLNSTLQAGFEMRDEQCVIVFDVKAGKKSYFLKEAYDLADKAGNDLPAAVLVENMTKDDYEQELIQAESNFDAKEDIELFNPAANDLGILTVGRLDGKWFAALKVKIGGKSITERLDSEQTCYKQAAELVKKVSFVTDADILVEAKNV